MNADEARAEWFLRRLGLGEPEFEPRGQKVWPDFAVGNVLAVEVRRLRQVHQRPGRRSGPFEFTSVGLETTVRNVLAAFASGNRSWFVYVRITDAIGDNEKAILSRALRTFLREVDDEQPIEHRGRLSPNSAVWVFPASKRFASRFVLAGPPTLNHGGFVVKELRVAIEFCIREKEPKIRPGYGKVWLLLVDHTGLFTCVDDVASAFRLVRKDHSFE